MFHVMLILIPLVMLVIMGSILLFGIALLFAGIIGGASVAMLVRNGTIKYLLIIGFCILLFVGSLCVIPIIGLFANIAVNLLRILGIMILALIGILALAGIKISNSIHNKIAKTILIIVFSVIWVVAIFLAVFAHSFVLI